MHLTVACALVSQSELLSAFAFRCPLCFGELVFQRKLSRVDLSSFNCHIIHVLCICAPSTTAGTVREAAVHSPFAHVPEIPSFPDLPPTGVFSSSMGLAEISVLDFFMCLKLHL